MFYLKCTAEVQRAIGLSKARLAEAEVSPAPLGNWLVHRFVIGRTHFYIFMSEVSLLSFVLYQGKRPVDTQTLPSMFLAGLAQLLSMQGLHADTVAQTLMHCRAGLLSKTDSRKTLGCMNDLVRCYATMVEAQGGLDTCDLTRIIQQMNDMPQRTLHWGTAWEVTQALLEVKGAKRH